MEENNCKEAEKELNQFLKKIFVIYKNEKDNNECNFVIPTNNENKYAA